MDKPSASFLLMSYNQQDFIVEAVQAAFAQTYTNLEIIISDDCSDDQTFQKIQDVSANYSGPHRLRINRNEKNLGLSAHVNWLAAASSGEYIVLAAGDDVSFPDRVEKSVSFLSENPDVPMVSMGFQTIDAAGRIEATSASATERYMDLDTYFSKRTFHPNGASRTYRRSIFERFGPLNVECPTEDTTLLLRAMMLGDIVDIPDIGIKYRRHGANLSSSESIAKMKLKRILEQYLKDISIAEKQGIHDDFRKGQIEEMVTDYMSRRTKYQTSRSLSRRILNKALRVARVSKSLR